MLCGDISCDCVVIEVLVGGFYPGCRNNGFVSGIAHDKDGNSIVKFCDGGTSEVVQQGLNMLRADVSVRR